MAAILGELGSELHRARGHHVVAEHHLVLALEDVVADDVGLDHVEVELLLHFAGDRAYRVLARLEVAGHEREESRRPTGVAREDDLALVLDDGADRGRGIVPAHISAGLRGTGEALYRLAVAGNGSGSEGRGATGAEPEIHDAGSRARGALSPIPSPKRAPRGCPWGWFPPPAPCPAARRPCRPPATRRRSPTRPASRP